MPSYITAQSKPSADTDTSIYTVSSGKYLVVSNINVANISNVAGDFFSLAIVPTGQSLTSSRYAIWNQAINTNMSVGDKIVAPPQSQIYVKARYGNCSFKLNAIETTATMVSVQSQPSANTDTSIYTVPAGKTLIISTVNIANVSSAAGDFIFLAVVPSGQSLTDSRYAIRNEAINTNMNIGDQIIAEAGSQIYVKATNGYCAFKINGIEV